MTTDALIDRIRGQAEAIRATGVTGLYIFGSRAGGNERDDSDLDAFVDIDKSRKFSLIDLVDLERLLERELGMRIDLTTRASLSPHVRTRVEAEAIRVL